MMEPVTTLPQAQTHTGCTCGDAHGLAAPELDARAIPHAIRHAAIFGALDSLPAGGALVLVAPHDPQPLLAQARDRYPEGVAVEYLQRGPEAWRIRLQRA
jgi:uncharacterized protein (DUF2249 family)